MLSGEDTRDSRSNTFYSKIIFVQFSFIITFISFKLFQFPLCAMHSLNREAPLIKVVSECIMKRTGSVPHAWRVLRKLL